MCIVIQIYNLLTLGGVKMKKVLSLLLAVTVLLSVATVTSAVKFADVDENYSWAVDAIEKLSNDKVITGYEDGTFKPGKSVTRQESIALFSKALGASAETNQAIVDFAYGIYGAELSECEDSYAVKQGAYLVYRKVFTVEEVINYLSVDNRNLELKRCEAATLIAKALGADSWFKNNPNADTTLSYADADDIPAQYVDYVYYTTALEIMGEMGENKFGPNESVTRAQIAVMINRISNAMNFEFKGGVIASVDTLSNSLTVKTEDGESIQQSVKNSDVIYIDASKASLTELEVGMSVAIILSNDSLYQIDAISYTEDEVFAGAYKGQITNNSGTTIKIADVTEETQPVSNLKLASNVVIIYNGEIIEEIDRIKIGDYVTVQLSGGLVIKLSVNPKEEVITSLKVNGIDATSENGTILTVVDKNGEEKDYLIDSNVSVVRNSATTSIIDLVVGDTVSLTLEYGVVSKIKATGVAKTAEGIIEEITISNATSYITISKDNSKSKYIMARDCEITIEGEKATIYDLRLGSYVKLKTESETVVKVTGEAVESALQVTGTIKTVNTAYNLLVLEVETTSGQKIEKQLFLKSTAKLIDSATGKTITIKNLKAGNIITAAGTEKLGVYEVNTLMVLQ